MAIVGGGTPTKTFSTRHGYACCKVVAPLQCRSSAVLSVWDSSKAASAEERRDSVPEDFRVETISRSVARVEAARQKCQGWSTGGGGRHRRTSDALRSALGRAREQTKEAPVDVQVKEGEQFLFRARAHCRDQQSARYNRIEHRGHRGLIGAIEGGGGDGSSAGTGASTGMGHRGSKVARGVGTGAQSSRRSHESPHPEFRRGREPFGGEGCQNVVPGS